MGRKAEMTRETKETRVQLALDLDGTGVAEVNTGVGFFDHMLELFARHSLFDLRLNCRGDTQVDDHHTVEDTGMVLGQAILAALGDKKGLGRFGFAACPLDEALARATVDVSGRPYFSRRGKWPRGKAGSFAVELAEDFFRALAHEARVTLHLELVAGRNAHHVVETAFKAVARALRAAVARDEREPGVPSTKGVL